ncbi:hypothetical protein KKF91_14880 [Myxococcota bacterium]|nr:hypothetical protein [Myxococcota bacterium]MBU1897319.1 hypothetical protein [Myxococcota bacterium]
MAARKPKIPAAEEVMRGVELILDDPQVVYFPVRHFSPVGAWHLSRLIYSLRPAAILVEGPEDATPLIEHLVNPQTRPPVTIFSTYTDDKNVFEHNGVLSPAPDVPARFRAWWPFTAWSPEYVALVAGQAVGASLSFIDLPLTARIPLFHLPQRTQTEVVGDADLAQSAYFEALRRKEGRRAFAEFWETHFEVGGLPDAPADPIDEAALRAEGRRYRQAALLFAWCARYAGRVLPLDQPDPSPGTAIREGHMRACIDAALKAHPQRPVLVVTGAFHSVALPFIKKQKSKHKKDKQLETLLTRHSFPALARLYDLERLPGYQAAVWAALEVGDLTPFNTASSQFIVEIMRASRAEKAAVSTADAVGAWHVAQNLATIRGAREVGLYDLLDAVQLGYVKGDRRVMGGEIERAARRVLIGAASGVVTDAAGQLPISGDFYRACRAFKLDVTGANKVVRLDLHKQRAHREKSAFLHRCAFLEIPFFGRLDNDAPFRGPNPITGQDMHLITEQWAVCWGEAVDERLLDISDRGASLELAAAAVLREQLVGCRDHAEDSAQRLLRAAQMRLVDLFDEVLDAVEAAVAGDNQFLSLVGALTDFVLLQAYRDTMATQGHARVTQTVQALFNKSLMVLPQLAHVSEQDQAKALDRFQALVRIALTFEGARLDRALLVERVEEMLAEEGGNPAARGAGFGVLFSFGAISERAIALELMSYLQGAHDRVVEAGRFLEGLFMNARSVFMRSRRLLRAINQVIGALDWAVFKQILPDLRRAFTQFIPTELDGIAARVSEEIGWSDEVDLNAPIPEGLVRVAAKADAAICAALEGG